MFTYLCLSGGGVAGFAQIGVLEKLYDKGFLSTVNTIVATSIGSVIGFLFAIGLHPKSIFEKVIELEDTKVLKYRELDNFFSKFGLDSGEYFIAHLVDILLEQNISPVLTFTQLEKKFRKRLFITGTNVTKHRTDYFSSQSTPDMKILDAIRISISIPFIFTAPKWKDCIYIDGGITDNFPIEFTLNEFKNLHPLQDAELYVLGCNIESMFPRKICSLEDFIYNLFACTIKRNRPVNYHVPSINIDIVDTSSIDFNVDRGKRLAMFHLGEQKAKDFIQSFNTRLKEHCRNSKRRGSCP
jgi:hypothetical protein